MSLKVPPILQMIALSALGWGLAKLVPSLGVDWAGRYAASALFITFGILLLAVPVRAFFVARTTVNPLEPQTAQVLVQDGLYRLSRNPMYLAMALILFGVAVFFGNLAASLAPILFVASITTFQIKPEERALKQIFGEDYEDYCRRTRRWI